MKYSISEIVAMVAKNDTRPFYNEGEWRKLSKDIIRKGNGECYLCRQQGKVSTAVLTHHVNELKKRPDLAYSRTYVDEKGMVRPQLIPLCHDCHEAIHERGIYADIGKPKENHFWQEEKW